LDANRHSNTVMGRGVYVPTCLLFYVILWYYFSYHEKERTCSS